ncbi:Winged helix-turn-helix DNA-binding domain [Phytophthora cactorum]|nr:Winged helix-turn-helix DNA-binding domain [Phytophthora cactorum]
MNATDAEAPRAPSSTAWWRPRSSLWRARTTSGPEGDSIQVDAGASASSDVRTRGDSNRDVVARAAEDASEDVVNMGTVTAQWAKNQIEFYFTSDNLDYESLLEAMKHSETVELDEQNEKIRLREGWQKWVWPNARRIWCAAIH